MLSPARWGSCSSAPRSPPADWSPERMTERMAGHRHRLINDGNRRWGTLGSMCFPMIMIILANEVRNVALLSIQRVLHHTLYALEWTMNAYTLTLAVLLVTGG